MSEQITSSNTIGVDGNVTLANQYAQKTGANDSVFSEKFQFSNILSTTMKFPEKTIFDSLKSNNPENARPVEEESYPDQKTYQNRSEDDLARSERSDPNIKYSQEHDSNNTPIKEDYPTQENSNYPDDGKNKASSEEKPAPDNIKTDNSNRESDNNQPQKIADKSLVEAGVSQNPAALPSITPIAALKVHVKPGAVDADKAPANVGQAPGKTPNNTQINTKAASEALPFAPRDQKPLKFNEELPKTILKNGKDVITGPRAPSIENSLANKQSQDLSNRLRNNLSSPLKVSVNTTENKMNSMPSHTKAPMAELAELSLAESLPKVATKKTSSTSDPRVINSNNNTPDTKPETQNQKINLVSPNQLVQLQSIGIKPQQSAMAPTAPITSDIPAITTTTGPNSSNLSQQITKADAPPPKPPAPIEQVAVQIKKAIGAGMDKINIKLNPAHLGKVEVKMEIARDGQLLATVIAERPETLELLQRDVRGLEKALQDGGLKTDMQSFNFSLKEHANQNAATGHDQAKGPNGKSDQNGSAAEDPYSAASQAAAYGQNVATNGGVDIRI
jgi:flagellar hook-length control protein FliK